MNKKFLLSTLILFLSLFLSNCDNDTSSKTSYLNDASVDAYIIKWIQKNDNTAYYYGMNFLAKAKDLESVTVKAPDESTYKLKKISSTVFAYETSVSDEENPNLVEEYSSLSFGDYTFTLKFSDGVKILTNYVPEDQEEIQSPPQDMGPSDLGSTKESPKINFKFKKAGNSDYYNITLLNEDKNESIYQCLEAPEEKLINEEDSDETPISFTIEKDVAISELEKDSGCASGSGWSEGITVNSNSTIYFQVSAFRYVRLEKTDEETGETTIEIINNNLQMVFPMTTPSQVNSLFLENW